MHLIYSTVYFGSISTSICQHQTCSFVDIKAISILIQNWWEHHFVLHHFNPSISQVGNIESNLSYKIETRDERKKSIKDFTEALHTQDSHYKSSDPRRPRFVCIDDLYLKYTDWCVSMKRKNLISTYNILCKYITQT